MTTRTRRETVYFKHPFNLQGIDRLLPAGPYEIVTDEEMIEGLSFPCYRRVATMIMVPIAASYTAAMENGVNQFGRSVRCAAQGRAFGLVIPPEGEWDRSQLRAEPDVGRRISGALATGKETMS